MTRKVFWCSGNGKKSVLASREWQEKCFGIAGIVRRVFGVAGMARKVFWRSENGKKSVLVHLEWQENCFGDTQPRSKGRTKYGGHL